MALPAAPSGPSGSWGPPIFGDEFAGTSIDRSLWGWGVGWNGSALWCPAANQSYETGVNKNDGTGVIVSNGMTLRATPIPGGPITVNSQRAYYQAGAVKTAPHDPANAAWTATGAGFKVNPGLGTYHFEWRAQYSPVYAQQWPAVWLRTFDQSWPPEIDLLEMLVGSFDQGRPRGTVHCGTTPGSDNLQQVIYQTPSSAPTWGAAFHTFGVTCGPAGIFAYIDGVPVGPGITDSTRLSKLAYWYVLTINLATVGTPGATLMDNVYRYLAVWRKTGDTGGCVGGGLAAGTTLASGGGGSPPPPPPPPPGVGGTIYLAGVSTPHSLNGGALRIPILGGFGDAASSHVVSGAPSPVTPLVRAYSPVFYAPLDEAGTEPGRIALDRSGNGRNGAYDASGITYGLTDTLGGTEYVNLNHAAGSTAQVGATTIGGLWDNAGAGYLVGNVFTPGHTGGAVDMKIYVKGGASTYRIKPVLYNASDGTHPTTLIGTGATYTIGVSQAPGWVTISLTGFNLVAGRSYWLGVQTDSAGGGGSLAYASSGGVNVFAPAGTFGSPPSTWPSGGGTVAALYSIYVDQQSDGPRVTFPHDPSFNRVGFQAATPWTIGGVFRFTDGSVVYPSLMSKGQTDNSDTYWLFFGVPGTRGLGFKVNGEQAATGGNVVPVVGTDFSAFVTWDATQLRFYVAGLPVYTATGLTAQTVSTSAPLLLGAGDAVSSLHGRTGKNFILAAAITDADALALHQDYPGH